MNVTVRRETSALECRGLVVTLGGRTILDGLDLQISAGESVAVMGPSGSGKTSLLNALAGLIAVDDGTVRIGDTELSGLSEAGKARFRLASIGMVFQFGELLPELSVAENVGLPLRMRRTMSEASVREALASVDLADLADAHPGELSGGEIQRAAIARALTGSPRLILADEPTGALDEDLSQHVCRLLVDNARRANAALVTVTHDVSVARAMDRTYLLRGGRLEPE